MKRRIRVVQQILQKKGYYSGCIDGVAGPLTMKGLGRIDGIDITLPKTRQITKCIQMEANERGIDAGPVDGLWGPRTNAAFEELAYRMENGKPIPAWRPDEIEIQNPNHWPVQRTSEFNEFYGVRGTRQKMLDFPYPMLLSWDLRIPCRRMQCHENVYDKSKAGSAKSEGDLR